MNDKTRNFIKGMGSTLDIMPARRNVDLSRFVLTQTSNERMVEVWRKVGDDIRAAMGQFDNGKNN